MKILKFDQAQSGSVFHWNKQIGSLVGFRYHIKNIYPKYDMRDRYTQIMICSPKTGKEMTFLYNDFVPTIGTKYECLDEPTLTLWIGFLESVEKLEMGELEEESGVDDD